MENAYVEFIAQYRSLLGLAGWRINVQIVDLDDLDEGCVGCTNYSYETMEATIIIASPGDSEAHGPWGWGVTALHELLHIALDRLFISGEGEWTPPPCGSLIYEATLTAMARAILANQNSTRYNAILFEDRRG